MAERVLEGGQSREGIVSRRGLAHDRDTPDRPLEVAEAGGGLDTAAAEQHPAHLPYSSPGTGSPLARSNAASALR